MTKVCITGGAGFIGSNIVKRLLKLGHEVVVIDNLETGKLENIKEFFENRNFEFIKASILDVKLLKEVLENVDCVFHKAALVDVDESVKKPDDTYRVNVLGTMNVLNNCVKNGVKKIVYASTCAIYEDRKAALEETSKIAPKNPYSVSKVVSEALIKAFEKRYGLRSVVLRYFNVYGPKQSPASRYAAVIPSFIIRAMKGENLLIHGDGKHTRDFVFVKDAVDANILALKSKKADGRVFNIGFGESTTINDLAKKTIMLAGGKSKIVHTKPRPTDIKYSLADISSAKKILNYKPKFDIDRGLEETIQWFKSLKTPKVENARG